MLRSHSLPHSELATVVAPYISRYFPSLVNASEELTAIGKFPGIFRPPLMTSWSSRDGTRSEAEDAEMEEGAEDDEDLDFVIDDSD